jgi:hypothetical protein
MRTLGGLCLAMLLWSAPVSGRDIFVDNVAGDDRAEGQKPGVTPEQGGPVRTIAQALRLAVGGETIVLAKTDQPYRESVTLVGNRSSGTARQPFMIRGNGAILDGSAPIPPEAWKNHAGAVFRFRPPRIGSQQLFLDDRPAAQVAVGHLAGGPPRLEPRQWCLLEGQIYFCVEPTKLPRDYQLSYTHLQTGVTLFHVEHVVIADLTVQGFQTDGIGLANSARHVSLVGVTCRGNGRSGVSVGGASSVEIDESLLGDNGVAQLLTLPYSKARVRHSHLLSNTAPGWVDLGGRVEIDGRHAQGGLDQPRPATLPEKKP